MGDSNNDLCLWVLWSDILSFCVARALCDGTVEIVGPIASSVEDVMLV